MGEKCYILMKATHETMKAEKILKSADLPFKVVVKPKQIKSKCGLAIRIDPDDLARIVAALAAGGVKPHEVYHF